jgi:hypothetical protein
MWAKSAVPLVRCPPRQTSEDLVSDLLASFLTRRSDCTTEVADADIQRDSQLEAALEVGFVLHPRCLEVIGIPQMGPQALVEQP